MLIRCCCVFALIMSLSTSLAWLPNANAASSSALDSPSEFAHAEDGGDIELLELLRAEHLAPSQLLAFLAALPYHGLKMANEIIRSNRPQKITVHVSEADYWAQHWFQMGGMFTGIAMTHYGWMKVADATVLQKKGLKALKSFPVARAGFIGAVGAVMLVKFVLDLKHSTAQLQQERNLYGVEGSTCIVELIRAPHFSDKMNYVMNCKDSQELPTMKGVISLASPQSSQKSISISVDGGPTYNFDPENRAFVSSL